MEYLIILYLSSSVDSRLNKLIYKHINLSVGALGIILWIRIFSYMEIRIYFHLLCNYLQTNQSSTDPPTCPATANLKKKKNDSKIFSFPKL